MAYIKRKGIILNAGTFLILVIIVVLFYFNADWDKQVTTLEKYTNSLPKQFTDLDASIIVLSLYMFLALIFSALWYLLGKIFAPIFIRPIIKYLGGISSRPFIDKDVNKKKISWVKFLIYYYNLAISLFAIDFLLANSIYYEQNVLPSIQSLMVALLVISALEPIYLIYDSVGIRSYNDRNSEIFSVSTIMGRMTFRLIQTGGLIAILASISINNDIIDSVPTNIRIIFVRTLLISTMTLYFFVTLFQSEAIFSDWKNKSIPGGKTQVKLDS